MFTPSAQNVLWGPPVAKPRAISAEQCRAARALLGWTQATLATRTGLARKTIAEFELNVRSFRYRTLRDIMAAFDEAGIEFTWADETDHPAGKGAGLRFARRPSSGA